nr:1-deoxy-D-xylulose-5-phosphate reductoisomerase [Eubacterium sp.]
EHSAIFQCLQRRAFSNENSNENKSKINYFDIFKTEEIETIYLTASGGPFRDSKYDDLKDVTVEQALAHPNWSMGSKITIDSATMVNKGLEIIEAKWLFGVDVEDIEVLVQRESIVHSMVGFRDGAVLAQMGTPDMRVPIQYALYYPDRVELDEERLDFGKIANISFEKPHTDVLRGIPLAVEALKIGGTMPTVMNAANEFAVSKFLKKEVSFLQIYGMIEDAMSQHSVVENPTLEDVLEAERWCYDTLSSFDD